MEDKLIQEKIDKVVDQYIAEMKLRAVIRKMISEKINRYLYEDDSEKSKASSDDNMEIKRNTVTSLLKKDVVKNSQFAYKIWPDMDEDTARSLFSKKVNGEPDNDGVVRKFTDEEISQLYELLRQI